MIPLRRSFAAMLLVAGWLVAHGAQAAPFTGLVVFGDSLSDSGNNQALGLYAPNQVVSGNDYVATFSYGPAGTYSNGPIWASYLAQSLNVTLSPSLRGGTNRANGGARLEEPGILLGYPYSLRTQVNQYLSANSGVAASDRLYVIAGGGNDARDALGSIAALPLDTVAGVDAAVRIFETTAASMARSISAMVDQLQAAGAVDIVVWNLPNLALAPSIARFGAGARQLAELVTAGWSQAIADAIAAEPDVALFDLFGIGSYVAAHGGDFGFANVSDVCGAAPVGTNCDSYLWWDGVHPTTRTHALLAEQMAALVSTPVLSVAAFAAAPEPSDSVSEPASLTLVFFTALALAALRRAKAVPVHRIG